MTEPDTSPRSAARRGVPPARVAVAGLAAVVLVGPVTAAAPALAGPARPGVPVATAAPAPVPAPRRPQASPSAVVLGAYTGPAGKGVTGAARFATWSGVGVARALDFAATGSWWSITGPDWMLDAWAGAGVQLEYSLPLFPDGTRSGLATCAGGGYDKHWRTLGVNLVRKGLADTVVRPGWEFNGTWYSWSAKGQASAFAACFRRVVTQMRSVAGQRFTFDWNPAVGRQAFPAEQAYPGDAYVDVIGVDVYDTLAYYRDRGETGAWLQDVQRKVWAATRDGDHGLAWWARFARTHGKPLSLTEWGLTSIPGGHHGADNPVFVDGIADFVADPSNGVQAALYFDAGSTQRRHQVTTGTLFPAAGARLKARWTALATASTSARLAVAPRVSRLLQAARVSGPAPRPGAWRPR